MIVQLLQTKAAFTRQYNKEVHMTPYSTGAVAKKKRGGGAGADLETLGEEGEDGGGAEDDVEEENGDDLETDTMIKVGIIVWVRIVCISARKLYNFQLETPIFCLKTVQRIILYVYSSFISETTWFMACICYVL